MVPCPVSVRAREHFGTVTAIINIIPHRRTLFNKQSISAKRINLYLRKESYLFVILYKKRGIQPCPIPIYETAYGAAFWAREAAWKNVLSWPRFQQMDSGPMKKPPPRSAGPSTPHPPKNEPTCAESSFPRRFCPCEGMLFPTRGGRKCGALPPSRFRYPKNAHRAAREPQHFV